MKTLTIRRLWTLSMLLVSGACAPRAPRAVAAPPPSGETSEPVAGEVHNALPVGPDEAFRATMPPLGPDGPPSPAVPSEFRLKNGAAVVLVQDASLPLVSFDLRWSGGAAADPKGKTGRASMCMELLGTGTTRLAPAEWRAALGDLASSIDGYATNDTHGVRFFTTTRFNDAFALFAELLSTPALPAAELARIRAQRLDGVMQSRATAAGVMGRVSTVIGNGVKHPFGKLVSEASVKAVTLADCKTFVAGLRPTGAQLFVAGAISRADLEAAFERPALHTFRGRAAKAPRIGPPQPMAGKLFFVDVPNSVQSSVWAFHEGPKRTDKGYVATSLLATVFGGGFNSRLNMNLREKHGYTYGARGGFRYMPGTGWFEAASQVRADATALALDEIVTEMRGLADGSRPVTAEEFTREQKGALSIAGDFATARLTRDAASRLAYMGLPFSSVMAEWQQTAALTADQVNATRRHLRPAQLQFVVVGDGATMVKTASGTDQPLRTALADAAKRLGGAFVELDADAQPKQ